MRVDGQDLKIINLLKDNSRTSISEMARVTGLSRQTIKSRLERLEEEQVIQKYTVKLSSELERSGSLILLTVRTQNPEEFDSYDEIVEVNKITSKRYIIKVVVKGMEELVNITNKAKFEVLEVTPVLESKEMERDLSVKVKFECDYCGKELTDNPFIYKRYNKVYMFCCKICLREFKRLDKED